MDLYQVPEMYEKLVHYDADKEVQIRLTVNSFRGVEYLHLRKYYLSFDEEWMPSNEGIAMPLTISNSRELFSGLTEILSLAESKEILEKEFKEQLDNIYLT
jgi:hypothetical protein|tara:strand:- start:28270 stop:28572 length:303 start_codon:yes stop_codon:yes gene_type:complete